MNYNDIVNIFKELYNIKLTKRTLWKYNSIGLLPEPLKVINKNKIFTNDTIGCVYAAWLLFKKHRTIKEVKKARNEALKYIDNEMEGKNPVIPRGDSEYYLLQMIKINMGYLPGDKVLVRKIDNGFSFSLEFARII